MKMIIFKNYFVVSFLLLCCLETGAQNTIDMVNKLGIKEDIEKLEKLVARKVNNDNFMRQFGELRQVHVFRLSMCHSGNTLTKNDWLNYSFLNYLKPNFVSIKEKIFGKKTRYLDAHTFLVSPDGYSIAVYVTGHKVFYLSAREMPKDLMTDDNLFIFMSSFDPCGCETNRSEYVVVKDNKLYGFRDFSDYEELIPWDTYLKGKYWK
jgi:hypothetical protein